MEALLNRWRGTGKIVGHVTGTMIYAMYLGLLFGLVTEWYIGILVLIGFLAGESFGWGKWIGVLTGKEIDLNKEYEDKEGYNFPYIHYIAECFVLERYDFILYCRVALFFRGLIWGLCIYLALVCFDYISIIEYVILSTIYGIGFPLACWLSTKKSFNYKRKHLSVVGTWESQEVYYGIFHFICNFYIVVKILILN